MPAPERGCLGSHLPLARNALPPGRLSKNSFPAKWGTHLAEF